MEKRSLSRLVLLDIIGLTGWGVCGLASPFNSRRVEEVRGGLDENGPESRVSRRGRSSCLCVGCSMMRAISRLPTLRSSVTGLAGVLLAERAWSRASNVVPALVKCNYSRQSEECCYNQTAQANQHPQRMSNTSAVVERQSGTAAAAERRCVG